MHPIPPAAELGSAMATFLSALNAGSVDLLADMIEDQFSPALLARYSAAGSQAARVQAAAARFHDLHRLYGPVEAWRVDRTFDPPIVWTSAPAVGNWIGFQPEADSIGRWDRLAVWRIRPPDTPDRAPVPRVALAESLSSFLAANAAAGRFSGVVIVARGDTVLFHEAHGTADGADPLTVDHRFNIGSVGKMLTAVAALQLVERGAVSLDDRLSEHVPEYPAAIGDAVTIRDLLTHTSGIELDDLEGFGAAIRTAGTMSEVLDVHLRYVREIAASYSHSGEFDYTNEGYSLLGLIVERASGRPWGERIQRSVLAPAGMGATTLAPPEDVPVAVGFTALDEDGEYAPGPRRPAWPLLKREAQPAGQQWSTAADLWSFWRALVSNELLSPATTRDMLTAQVDAGALPAFGLRSAYGFGIQIETRDGRTHAGHGGVVPGYSAAVRAFPAAGATVVVLSNLGDTAAHIAAEHVEELLLGRR